MKKLFLFFALFLTTLGTQAQQTWQQHIDYEMDVMVDAQNFTYKGQQKMVYTNHSPDTLRKVFIHLYYNAFQPNSEMDIRLQTIADPDERMVKTFKVAEKTIKESKIKDLKPTEIGFLKLSNISQDGLPVVANVHETIAEITLATPLLPQQKTTFQLNFEGQVPVMIRRAGRNSAEGVALSMAQWYPKMAEYDFEGWHPDPYIGREFHGVWGNFDVKITIGKEYMLGGTGYLQNKNEIGKGYQDEGIILKKLPKKQKTLTWHFIAPQVHDFTWAADKDFIHDKIIGENGVELHFLYKNNPEIIEKWKALQPKTAQLLSYFNTHIGTYPYKQYSIIQGGDGGMEYAMCTLITGKRSLPSLVGVTAHEMAHSWFQHVLAFNESKHSWMDEGFTSYISDAAMYELMPPKEKLVNIFEDSYKGYIKLAKSGKEQSLTTHSDRYTYNNAYGNAAYSKGTVFLSQLGYVIGNENLSKTLKRFYKEFKFKHPNPNDFKRTAEKVSGAVLDWYLIDFAQTTNTIDYAIQAVTETENQTQVSLKRIGLMPMPLDILVKYTNGTQAYYHIPNPLMRWVKPNPYPTLAWNVLKGWDWGKPTYDFLLPSPKTTIQSITIDPQGFMADVNKENNEVLLKEASKN